jgi:hypothetical protein
VQPNHRLMDACIGPVDIGDAALTQQQTEDLWSTDRERLLTCARRQLSLRNFVRDRDAGLTGASAVPVPTPRPAI